MKTKPTIFYWLSFETWSSSHGDVFTSYRVYTKHHWTPFVRVTVRYPLKSFWRGIWPTQVATD